MPGFRAQNHLDHWPVPAQDYFAPSVYFIFLLILLQGYWRCLDTTSMSLDAVDLRAQALGKCQGHKGCLQKRRKSFSAALLKLIKRQC